MRAGLVLKRGSASRPSGQWRDDDYNVLENGVVVGRIFCLDAVGPQGRSRMGASGHNGEIGRAASGYDATREAAMAAFAKSGGGVKRMPSCGGTFRPTRVWYSMVMAPDLVVGLAICLLMGFTPGYGVRSFISRRRQRARRRRLG
jgi:hypothetical protein